MGIYMEKNQKACKISGIGLLGSFKSVKLDSFTVKKIAEKENEKRVIEAHGNY